VDGKMKKFVSLTKYWHVLDQILLLEGSLSADVLTDMIANRLEPSSTGAFFIVNEYGVKKRFSRDITKNDIICRRRAMQFYPLRTKAIMRLGYKFVFLPSSHEPECPSKGNIELRITLRKMYLEWLGEKQLRLQGRYRISAQRYILHEVMKDFTFFFWKHSSGRWEDSPTNVSKKRVLSYLEQIEEAEAHRRSVPT
jgi:hypothetical protein